jgi:hypothetical protein
MMLTLKNRYLREMGVDVWVPRGSRAVAVPATASPPGVTVPPTANTSLPVVADTAAPGVAPTARAFHLCFCTYPGVSLVFSIPFSETEPPPEYRRLADDLGLALVGAKESTMATLRWPMVQSVHIDQSEAAARQAVGQRLARCAAALILFGDDAFKYGATGSPALRLVDLAEYLRTPASKRQLWHALRAFRHELET